MASVTGRIVFDSEHEMDSYIRNQFPDLVVVLGAYPNGTHPLNDGGSLVVRGLEITWDRRSKRDPYVEGPNCTLEGDGDDQVAI